MQEVELPDRPMELLSRKSEIGVKRTIEGAWLNSQFFLDTYRVKPPKPEQELIMIVDPRVVPSELVSDRQHHNRRTVNWQNLREADSRREKVVGDLALAKLDALAARETRAGGRGPLHPKAATAEEEGEGRVGDQDDAPLATTNNNTNTNTNTMYQSEEVQDDEFDLDEDDDYLQMEQFDDDDGYIDEDDDVVGEAYY